MLSDYDLARLRSQQNDNMPSVGTIYRSGRESDGFGGWTPTTEVAVEENVPCRVTPAQVMEGLGELARPVETYIYTVRFPTGTNVLDEDVLELSTGERLKIESVKSPRSWDTVVTCQAEVIR